MINMGERRNTSLLDYPFPWSSSSWMSNRGISENDAVYWGMSERNRRVLFEEGYRTGENVDMYIKDLDMKDPHAKEIIEERDRKHREWSQRREHPQEHEEPQKSGPVKRFLNYIFGE